MVDHINNGESGLSVRGKLNEVIDRTNTLNGVENQVETNKQNIAKNATEIDELWTHVGDVEDLIEDLDGSILLDKLDQEIIDRTEGDQALQDQIDDLLAQPGAGMVISETEPTAEERVPGLQWLDSTTAEVWIWDGVRWLEFPSAEGPAGPAGADGDTY